MNQIDITKGIVPRPRSSNQLSEAAATTIFSRAIFESERSLPMTAPEFLIISGHDYRSKRKANMHFLAEVLARRGKVNFYSIGFSYFSMIKSDPRAELWEKANAVEQLDGVQCYLERNLVHPFRIGRDWLHAPEAAWFASYAHKPRKQFWDWVATAQTIIFESGISVLLAEQVAIANPTAKKIYLASDDLETIGCSEVLSRVLDQAAASFTHAVLPSRLLARAVPARMPKAYVPHGFDKAAFLPASESPFSGAINAVSVGSMLFDANFFRVACAEFPKVTFHVIGGGRNSAGLVAKNLVVLPEMPFSETVRYIRHASVGIAAYTANHAPYYLSDTSMKLWQYQYVGLNSVCPFFACGELPGRFGYDPDNDASIVSALDRALGATRFEPDHSLFLDWSDVVDRILSPREYADTKI
jgi:2-beta-glucuronyltransferase